PVGGLLSSIQIVYNPALLPLSGSLNAKWKGSAAELNALMEQVMEGAVALPLIIGNDVGEGSVDFNGPNVRVNAKGSPLLELKIEVK
ncbi:MAG: hypothetical protein ACE5GQ_08080, partial [Nitrospinales bacterium]